MGTINVKNVVTDYGATGNGTTNDRPAIQNALDAADIDGGGIVFFPKGTYLIDNTLKLPNKVQMLGLGGTTFGAGSNDISLAATPADFLSQAVSVIKLANNSNVNMIEQKNNSTCILYNAGIENLILYGNKSQQTAGNGIHLTNITSDSNSERGHNRFRNIFIYNVKQTGFFCGTRHHELHLDNVIAYGCGTDGFEFHGEDMKANRIQSAANGNVGIKITDGGAGRFTDIDVWANDIAIEIYDTMNVFFLGLTSSSNNKYGLYIHTNSWAPWQIQIFRGNFEGNSKSGNNSYPEVRITSSSPIFGPQCIEFIACLFRGSYSNPKPSYAILDDSYQPARNIVTNCFFQRSNYAAGIINNNQIYSFNTNYDYDTRRCLDEFTVPYDFKNANYALLITDCYLTIDCASGNKTITLPRFANTQLGKIFIVSKSESSANSVTVNVTTGDTMVGVNTLTQIYQTLMIINAGANWYSIRIN